MYETYDAAPATAVDGEDALVVCSNNYLGLATHDRLADAAAEAAREYGTGAGASRLVSGNLEPHRELEDALASLKRTETALVFSSGYAANVGTLGALLDERDAVFSDSLNHASIIDGCRLSGADVHVYEHADADDLREKYGSVDARRKLVVTDTVFSMDGDVAPLEELASVTRDDPDGYLMVDEAHATGVVGDEGTGAVGELGLTDVVDIQIGTLSKALGSQGGFVAADNDTRSLLVNEARSFVYSTGLSPVDAAVSREAVSVVRGDEGDALRDDLRENVALVRERVEDAGYEVYGDTHILPVVVGEAEEALAVADQLRDHGVFAPAIRPPTVPEGTSRIRISMTAAHTHDHAERVARAFEEAV
ncbi:MAG: 8-amino-7-oxononanoate synthase [Halobacteriales archaeon]